VDIFISFLKATGAIIVTLFMAGLIMYGVEQNGLMTFAVVVVCLTTLLWWIFYRLSQL